MEAKNASVNAWVQTALVRASADWRVESPGYVVVVTCAEARKCSRLPELYNKSSRRPSNK